MRALIPTLLLFVVACSTPTPKQESKPSEPDFAVEKVEMVKEFPNAWAVKGMVRNNSGHSAEIAVIVKFVNERGDILHTSKATVNGFDALENGQAGPFKYTTDPEDFNGVTDYRIEPYERN